MSSKSWKKFVDPSLQKRHDQDRIHKIKQLLSDLGFLEDENSSLARAVGHFRKEYTKSGILPEHKIDLFSKPPGLLDPAELTLITQLCSFDGEWQFSAFPQVGDQNLTSRVLIYRLNCLGLTKVLPHSAFTKAVLKKFDLLLTWTKLDGKHLQVFNTSGDMLSLIKLLIKNGGLDQRVVTFALKGNQLDPMLLEETIEESGETDDEKEMEKQEKEVDETINKVESKTEKLKNYTKLKNGRIEKIKAMIEQLLVLEKDYLEKTLQNQRDLKSMLAKSETQIANHNEKLEANKQKAILSILELNNAALALPEKKKILNNLKQLRQLYFNSNSNQKVFIKKIQQIFEKLTKWMPANMITKHLNLHQQLATVNINTKLLLQKANSDAKEFKLNLAKEVAESSEKISQKQLEIHQKVKQMRALQKKAQGLKFKFKAKLKASLDPVFYRTIKNKIFIQNDNTFLVQNTKESYNTFLIRLIQVFQWTQGYYQGRLDSKFQTRTFESIVDLVEDLPGLRLKYVLSKLKKSDQDYWILNVAYLFQTMATNQSNRDANPLDTSQLLEKINKSGAGPALETAVVEEEFQTGRKNYFGRINIFRSIFRGLGRLIQILKRGIEKTIQFFKSFVQFIYEEIREAGLIFYQSLDFIFGRRTELPFVALDPQLAKPFAYDNLLTPDQNASKALISLEGRFQALDRSSKSISFTMNFLKKMLTYGVQLATGGISWPKLLLQLVMFLKGLIVKWIRSRLRPKTTQLAMAAIS